MTPEIRAAAVRSEVEGLARQQVPVEGISHARILDFALGILCDNFVRLQIENESLKAAQNQSAAQDMLESR